MSRDYLHLVGHDPAMGFGEQPESSKLASLWFDQVAIDDGTDYLVKGLLSDPGLSMIYGPSGCGKSFLATDLALAVARGVPWFDRRVRTGGVVYIAAEGQYGFKKRLAAYRQAYLGEGETAIPFRLVPVPVQVAEGRDKAELIRLIEEGCPDGGPIRLVVIDTLARTITGDENSAEDMSRFVAALTAVQAATSAHVMIVHHCGKNVANGARGHSSLLAAVDTAIEITREGEARTATIIKQKDGCDGDTFGFALKVHDLGDDADGDPVTSCTVEPADKVSKSDAPSVTPNQRTMFSILKEAGTGGLTSEDWNTKARAEGIGERRRADLRDNRVALKAKGLIYEFNEHWFVQGSGVM